MELLVGDGSLAASYDLSGVGLFVGFLFFASFDVSERLGISEEFFSLGTGVEGFLEPMAPFESSGGGLLGSRGDWDPPRVGRLVSGLWVRRDIMAAPYNLSGVGLLVGIFYCAFLVRPRGWGHWRSF